MLKLFDSIPHKGQVVFMYQSVVVVVHVVRWFVVARPPYRSMLRRQVGIFRTMRKLMDAIPTNVYGPPQRNAADRTIICRFSESRFRNPKSGMRYGGGDGTSSVTPWGRTFNVLGGGESWRKGTGKGGRKGSKEGIEGKAHGLAH